MNDQTQPTPQAAQSYQPGSPPGGQFASSPPMQVNDAMAGLQNIGNPPAAVDPSAAEHDFTQGQQVPNNLGINMPENIPFGTPSGATQTPASPPSDSGDAGGLLASIPGLLPLLGPEGMLAKAVIGGAIGLGAGILSGGNAKQVGLDTATGAFALTKLADLVQPSWLLGLASKKIDTALTAGDAILDSNPLGKAQVLSNSLEKEFGSISNPNMSLIPNAPAGEMDSLKAILGREIQTQGQGGIGNLSLKQIQAYKAGAGAKAGYDKSITDSAQKLYGNISRAYQNVLNVHAPGIQEADKDYAQASKVKALHDAVE